MSDLIVSVCPMTAANVNAALTRAQNQAHEVETILRTQIGTQLSIDQWLQRAAILSQLAHVDAMTGLAQSNLLLEDKLAEVSARALGADDIPVDVGQPFLGYRFG